MKKRRPSVDRRKALVIAAYGIIAKRRFEGLRLREVASIQAFDFSAAAKPHPWNTTHVTLIGDALHHMPPVGGMGGNAALHDAALLCNTLLSVKDRNHLLTSLHACETEMLRTGFRAVNASLLYTKLSISQIPLMRQFAKLFFRSCGLIGPLRRAIFEESPVSS